MHLPICPCCTGAVLVTLAQNASWLATQSFLQLGQGALLANIGHLAEAEMTESELQSAPFDSAGLMISNLET